MSDQSAFYSDIVEKEIEHPFKAIVMYREYAAMVEQHLVDCAKFISENPGVQSVCLQFQVDEQNVMQCIIRGNIPWSKERMEEFSKAVGTERDEVSQLKELLTKYPSKALLFLSELQEKNK